MRYLVKFVMLVLLLLPVSVWAAGSCSNVACSEGEVLETPVQPPKFEVCDYFHEPVQSWKTGSTVFLSGAKQGDDVSNPSEAGPFDFYYYFGGWSKSYVSTYTQPTEFEKYPDNVTYNMLSLPFDNLTGGVSIDAYNFHNTCQSGPCQVAQDGQPKPPKISTPPELTPNFTSTIDLRLEPSSGSPNSFDTRCPVDGTVSYCQSQIGSDGVRTVIIKEDLNSLSISAGASGEATSGTIILKIEPNTDDLVYGRKIKSLDIPNGSVITQFDLDGVYTFDSFKYSQQSTVNINAIIRWNIVTELNFANGTVLTNKLEKPEDFVIYGPTASLTFVGELPYIYGMFLADKVSFTNSVTMWGSVTSNDLTMGTNEQVIIGAGGCIDPQPSTTYTLDVTPDNQFALLCQAPEMTFTVYNDDGSVATDYDGTITATFPDGLTPSTPIVGTQNSEYVYTPNQGEVVVPVKSATLQEYTINAELTDDSDAKDSGQVLFGPYQFSADPVKAVAGHPTQFDVQVLACKNDQVTPVQGYNGDKDLTITDVTLTKPTINQGAIDGGLEVSDTESGSYSNSDVTLNFSDDAKSQAYLRYNESGSLNFTLTDPEFVCPTEYDGCEVTNDDGTSENITSLQGIVNVDVRPWAFAICSPTNQDMSGDSDGGTGFIAAGEKFNLEVKPIVWQNGGSLTDDIDVSGYCNATVTQNFLLSKAQPATVLMASTLATPTQGRLGSGVQTDEGGSLEREHDAVLNSGDDYYTYAGLTWQEVGSLNITADSTDNYLDMNINQGYREIGRFYPHHFKLENDNSWHYASGLNGFAYMNQPIAMDYQVKAKSAADSDTENYGYFVDTLKASLMIEAIEKSVVFGTTVEGDSLSERFIVGDNQSLNNWNKATYKFNSNDFMFLKDHSTNSPYTTTPDGPYDSDNSIFGVAVDPSNSTFSNDDNVNFDQDFVDTSTFKAINGLDELGVEFFSQPDFRYGRMVLDAVSSPIGGPVSVPLRVEYWDNTNFVVNSDDSGSRFKADVYYVMSNINGSLAKLSGSNASSFNTVSSGKSSVLQAKQDSAERETVRLFLRQSNSASGYGNNPEPAADNKLNATVAGWKNAENIEQPWLQFNWRNKGDEDPSTVVTFGAYRGNDRIIFRGEELLTEN